MIEELKKQEEEVAAQQWKEIVEQHRKDKPMEEARKEREKQKEK